jgi:putative transferase (TIGR04331 family)
LIARTLITTADERTWPKDKNRQVLFLGEWCKRYSRKEVWRKMDAEIASYHWDDREKLFKDYRYLQEVYEKLLAELSERLNHIHSVDHSLRYWRILIGPWLGYFIQMLFDRWFMLKLIIHQKEIIDCRILERDTISMVPNDMAHFTGLFRGDNWNETVYGQLLDICWRDEVNIVKVCAPEVDKKQNDDVNQGAKTTLIRNIERWLFLFNKLFPKDDGYFFISSYLPLKIDFKLQIRLGQFPKLWRSQPIPVTKPSIQKRQWRLGDNEFKNDSFEAIAYQLIPLHIPTAYLEGYQQLVKIAGLLNWPKKPKSIFTSNAYLEDDLFKVWAAEKTESGVPLIIGQHGGHFGMTPFAFHEEHQISIADTWLSWGWSDQKRPEIKPVGNLKGFGRSVNYDSNGGALMVEVAQPRYSYELRAMPISKQWLVYFEDQQHFLKALPHELCKQVLVRLKRDHGWDQILRWKNQMPEVKIDPKRQNISSLIKKRRLYIATYNATTYLESLSWNIPTIIFWNPNYWELKEEVKPYFELLKSVGIFHENPESAAKHMIKVWDDVATWWESDEVQGVRKQFCYQFARIPDDPEGDLLKILQNPFDLSLKN